MHRIHILIGAVLTIVLCVAALPPIIQDPHYHAFADARPLFGIPNFYNVISNVPFLMVAAWGLRKAHTARERVLLAGLAMVGIGSTYYHLHPTNATLLWDRLPMTVVFMSLLAALITERINDKVGRLSLVPLVLFGIASVLYWSFSGDLRPYVVVQFGAMLTVPLVLVLFPASNALWFTVVLYALAKVLELGDHQIAAVIGTGGHPWKHVVAATAIFVYVRSRNIGDNRSKPGDY